MINNSRRQCTMCQADKRWKRSRITVSGSVSIWHILERRGIYASLVGMVCPKGHQEMPGKSQLPCLRLASCPRQTAFAGVQEQQGGSRLGNTWEIPTKHSHSKHVLVLYSSAPSSSCSFSFILLDTVTSSLRLISYISKQSPAPNEFSFSRFAGLRA